MAEIKTPPIELICIDENDVEHPEIYYAFGEDHTLSDIARWIMSIGRSDAEEIHYMIGKMLNEDEGVAHEL